MTGVRSRSCSPTSVSVVVGTSSSVDWDSVGSESTSIPSSVCVEVLFCVWGAVGNSSPETKYVAKARVGLSTDVSWNFESSLCTCSSGFKSLLEHLATYVLAALT